MLRACHKLTGRHGWCPSRSACCCEIKESPVPHEVGSDDVEETRLEHRLNDFRLLRTEGGNFATGAKLSVGIERALAEAERRVREEIRELASEMSAS